MVYKVLLNAGISVAVYLPWLLVFISQARTLQETGWWQEAGLSLKDIYKYLVWPFQDRTGLEPIFFFTNSVPVSSVT